MKFFTYLKALIQSLLKCVKRSEKKELMFRRRGELTFRKDDLY